MTWKDHPLAVAVISSTSTVLLFFTVILPTWMKHKDNEVITQQAQIRNLEREVAGLKAKHEESMRQLRQSESDIVKLRRELDKLSPDSIFSVDDVYPKGFRAVRIGDNIDMVSQTYSAVANIEDQDGWLEVHLKPPSSPFSSIFYLYTRAGVKTVTVVDITFFFSSKSDETFNAFKEQLIQKFGRTNMREITERQRKKLVWSNIQNYTLTLREDYFSISLSQ